MKNLSRKNSLFWWIPVGVLIVMGLVFGTSFDAPISNALMVKGNLYSQVFTVIGSLPTFVLLGFVGPLLYMFFNAQNFKGSKIVSKIVFFAVPFVAGVGYGIDILKDFMKTPIALIGGAAIVVALVCLLCIPFKNGDPKHAIRDAIVIGFTIGLSIIIGLLFKKIFVRPRPLAVADDPSIFTQWFNALGNKITGVDEDLLDSFPSGHATLASNLFLAALLAKYNPKTEKFDWLFFACAGGWLLLTGFARISGGWHYLSDVSFGSLIGAGLAFLFNFFIKVPLAEKNG